jgi:predicted nucleic acid-binding protein
MTLLIDTGILLRFLDRTDRLHADIRQAIRTVRGRGDKPVTSPQNVAEFWSVSTRPATARGGYGLSVEETDRRVRVVERIIPVLPDAADAYRHWRQLVTDHAVKGVQVHDARLVAWMAAHGITHIVTLNGTDFTRYPGIVPLAPADILAVP